MTPREGDPVQPAETITPAQLPEVLLRVATVRPVHLWGPPGIGKSALVTSFAADVGLPCVTLLGTQLAPEDLIGVPQIVTGADGLARSRFCPPEQIARTDPYVLFLDELNGSSTDVQKAFYSLVLERRLGNYTLPHGSVVIAAGNRATDQAIVRPMSSALANRFVHLHLRASTRDWLAWAGAAGVHPWITDYLRLRADHLWVAPPKTEEAFSTPRSWHALSDTLHGWGTDITEAQIAMLAHGCLSPPHAASFAAFVRTRLHAYDLEAVLAGTARWPDSPGDRDLLHFLAVSLRARLVKELPADTRGAPPAARQLAIRAKGLLVELADISAELAQLVLAGDDDGNPLLPAWFLTEVVRDLPRLVAARAG
jgi:hypothetical protein